MEVKVKYLIKGSSLLMKKTKVNPLVSHFTVAFILLAALWIFVSEKDLLVLGNSLILVYVVYALGSRVMPRKHKKK
uniref:Uncharacterized protein n=1 Tax=Pseudoalteromonas citrea DSM 8771 TaxID=1117314 RepID=U1KUP2_9GAMM